MRLLLRTMPCKKSAYSTSVFAPLSDRIMVLILWIKPSSLHLLNIITPYIKLSAAIFFSLQFSNSSIQANSLYVIGHMVFNSSTICSYEKLLSLSKLRLRSIEFVSLLATPRNSTFIISKIPSKNDSSVLVGWTGRIIYKKKLIYMM